MTSLLIGQYLTFELADEKYGIEVKSIREILEMQPITSVPRTSDYLLGVMNVRGRVVPVVDLRLKFGLEKAELTVNSAIIVLDLGKDANDSLIGLLVDRVDEVLSLGEDEVEAAPGIGTSVNGQFLKGMGKSDKGFTLLLDTVEIFSKDKELNIEDVRPASDPKEDISA